MTLTDDATAEVHDLHEFFQSWFRGEIDADTATHPRNSLAPAFRMISPDGTESSREEVLDGIESARGSEADRDPPFVIEIRNCGVHNEFSDHCQLRYEEWQRRDGEWSVRVSTALFRREESAPNGVVWTDLHETWREESTE